MATSPKHDWQSQTLCQSCNPSFIFVCFAEQDTTQKRNERGHKTRKTEQKTKNINRIRCENVEAAMVLNQTDRQTDRTIARGMAYVIIVIAKTSTICGKNQVGASTKVLRHFSKRIALSWDASRGLGDPFCFGFSPKKDTTQTQHRREEREGEENKTENEEIQRASNAKKRRRNNERKTQKKGDEMELVRLVKYSRKQVPQCSCDVRLRSSHVLQRMTLHKRGMDEDTRRSSMAGNREKNNEEEPEEKHLRMEGKKRGCQRCNNRLHEDLPSSMQIANN